MFLHVFYTKDIEGGGVLINNKLLEVENYHLIFFMITNTPPPKIIRVKNV
jgi:hypothetical protein